MGDMGQPLPASRLAVLPATSHTAVITQSDLLLAVIEPFLKGETPKSFFQDSDGRRGTAKCAFGCRLSAIG